ncbi:MAG: hypothetical protein JWO88_739 [Frankiales bacterium]|jgi:hypothetical protein|nr:hypothetical protein [Frankiales bacterium]
MPSEECAIPEPIRRSLAGDGLDGFTLELITTDTDDWPHVALLSVGEVLALTGPHLRLALWPSSTTASNLQRTNRGTLATVADATAYRLKLQVIPRGTLDGPAGPSAVFDARVVSVREDVAPYAVLESGIRFRLVEPDAVTARWAATRDWLVGLGLPAS